MMGVEDKLKNKISPELILRIGLSGVFIYTGISILEMPNLWLGFTPLWIENFLPISLFLKIYAIFELTVGLLLLVGRATPLFSFIAFLDMLTVIIFAGIDVVTFRDFGLLMAALALFIISYDRLSSFSIKGTNEKPK